MINMKTESANIRWESPAVAPNGQPYLSIMENGGFFYARRAGINSIAFVLKDGNRWGLLRCRHGGTGFVANRAFTGSLDNSDSSKSIVDVVIAEAAEESGYVITTDRVYNIGLYEVGHMTDEKVWLFWIDVSGLSPKPVQWQGLEARDLVGTVWNATTHDWRARIILDEMYLGE